MGWLWTPIIIYVLFAAVLFVAQRKMLYHPPPGRPDPARYGVAGLTTVDIETEDGLTLSHWYRPPARPGGPVIVMFHGNAGHVGDRVDKLRALYKTDFGIFLVEYRGFGGNPGSPSEDGLLADARSVVAWLRRNGVEPAETIMYGESLGTGVAVQTAAAQARGDLDPGDLDPGGRAAPFAGVLLESPYTSIADVAQHHYWYLPARWLLLDKWDSAAVIGQIGAPLLVLHGRADNTVPFKFGKRLYEMAPEPKAALFLPDGNHTDLFNMPDVIAAVTDFVERTTSPANPAEAPAE